MPSKPEARRSGRIVREPVYEITIKESGTNRIVYTETVHGRLMPLIRDPESMLRYRIEAEDNTKYFLRTPETEARNGRRS